MAKRLLKKAGLNLTCQIPAQQNGIPKQIQSGRGIAPPDYSMFNNNNLTEIFDSVFLGDYENACDYEKLCAAHITHIINCDPQGCENLFPTKFNYSCLEISDNILFDISRAIQCAIELINQIRKVSGRVLIHCQRGISRAPAIMLAYIISEKSMSPQESLDYLKEKYKKADPNLGFMLQLDEFYKNKSDHIMC